MEEFNPEKEEILKPNTNRFVLFPIKYQDLWELYKLSLGSFWTEDEIDFSIDISDYNDKLNDNERYFIKNVLAFFAASDGIVNENLVVNFYKEIQIPEARHLYTAQMLIESVHSTTYSLMIDTYIKDPTEKETLFNSMETNPVVQKKANWALRWIDNGTFPERLLAFAAVEGIFFSASFASIYWLKSRGLMKALSFANNLIARDEALHCKTCVMIYDKLEQKLPESRVHEIFRDAYAIEQEFITKSLPVSLIGMNAKLMTEYVQFVTDYWLVQLNYNKLFNTKNPFDFMNYLAIETKVNFFEGRNHAYAKANVNTSKEDNTFNLDADF
jgi:ribonucleoside-diphosphate reductase beta chain